MQTKVCTMCKSAKPLSEFNFCRAKNGKKYPSSMCKACNTVYMTRYAHEKEGVTPYEHNPACSQYLGIHIAERILSHCFEDVKRMPYGNPGYDFICKRGFKIDVKSGCLRAMKRVKSTNYYWMFQIDRNAVADYFLCLAFDSRETLSPEHVWLIPGMVVNQTQNLSIPSSDYGIRKWSVYERPLDKILVCCDILRDQAV